MKNFLAILIMFCMNSAYAQTAIDVKLAQKCYHKAAAEAGLVLENSENTNSMSMIETICAENTASEDQKNYCIQEGYTEAAIDLIKEFGLEEAKSSTACQLAIQ